MKTESLRVEPLRALSFPTGGAVEALPVSGETPDLFPGQRLTATVLAFNGQQALIDLQGVQTALLTALPGLRVGSELHMTVAQVAPKLLLEVAPGQVKPSPVLPPLAVGQEVSAAVVEQLPNGAVLIDLQGALLEAEAPNALPPGNTFSARVEQVRPQVILRLLPETEEENRTDSVQHIHTEATRLLRARIPHHPAVAETLTELTQELTTLVGRPLQENIPPSLTKLQEFIKTLLPDHEPPTAERLAAFIRDGGLHYEAKLARLMESNPQALPRAVEEDLKGLLLQALHDLESAALQQTDTTLLHHLEHIERQQAVNVLAQTQGEPYRVQIPFYTAQRLTTAFLAIESDSDGQGEQENGNTGAQEKGYTILFFLDLEDFGQTRIEARIGKKSLRAAFYVDQSASVALLQQELPAFREILQSLGYEDVLLVAKPLGQLSPEKRQKFETLTVGVPTSVRLLDVKV
jgi:hypothetical protein